jgi:hypothetical protein
MEHSAHRTNQGTSPTAGRVEPEIDQPVGGILEDAAILEPLIQFEWDRTTDAIYGMTESSRRRGYAVLLDSGDMYREGGFLIGAVHPCDDGELLTRFLISLVTSPDIAEQLYSGPPATASGPDGVLAADQIERILAAMREFRRDD